MRFILLTVALLVRARQFPVSFCVLESLIKFRFSPTWDHLLPQILRIHLNIKEFLVQSALRIQLVIYTEDNPSKFSSSTYWGYPPHVFNFYILRISTLCFQILYTEDILFRFNTVHTHDPRKLRGPEICVGTSSRGAKEADKLAPRKTGTFSGSPGDTSSMSQSFL